MWKSAMLTAAAVLVPMLAPGTAHAQKDVLEITAPVLDRFLVAAQKNTTERERLYASDPATGEVLKEEKCYANLKANEDGSHCERPSGNSAMDKWQQCISGYEAKQEKLWAELKAADKKKDKAAVEALSKQGEALDRQSRKECGDEPFDEGSEEEESSEEADAQAAAEQELADKMYGFDDQAAAAAAAAGGFTPRQYAIVRERVIAYLRRQAGDTSSNYSGYKFSAAEMAALKSYADRLSAVLRTELM